MKYTKTERLILSNQLKILSLLKCNDYTEETYKAHIQALEDGYEYEYDEVAQHISDPMSEEDCREVYDILQMFRMLSLSYSKLTDKSGIDEKQVKFNGFDGNYETSQYGYCMFIIDVKGRFDKSMLTGELNSHAPRLKYYREMLKRWSSLGKPGDVLTRDQILKVIEG